MGHNTSVPVFSHNRDPIKVDKGVYKGSCNRARCQKPHATYYARSTYKYYCEACAQKLNEYNPPSEEMIRAGIVGTLCIPDTDPSHPYFDVRGQMFVPHSEDIRQVIKNIIEEHEKVPDGGIFMKEILSWSPILNPQFVKELIIDEVSTYNKVRGKP